MAMDSGDRKLGLGVFAAVAVLGLAAHFAWPPLTVPVTVGAAAGLLAALYRRWKGDSAFRVGEAVRQVSSELDVVRADIRGTRVEIEETRALVALQEPRFTMPLPWTNWALPPRGLLEVLKTIQEFDAPVIVDCGTGVSTLHLARAVREIGKGRVIALEQDADWAAFVRKLLERNGLQQYVTIHVTQLENTTICGRETQWYALPADLLDANARIDVVIADGPTGRDGSLTRIGALPRFWERLSDRGAVFLDDTRRPEEQEICRIWREQFAVSETSVGTEHGMSKFTRRRA
jgi:hypothetical protein